MIAETSFITFSSIFQVEAAAAAATVDYQRFSDIMDQWGYDWEAHKVTTEDHYILTTFHILSKKGESTSAESKGTVLCQHDIYEDGASWLAPFDGKPFHLSLVDEGYDVWIGNNRGTEYSQEHETLSPKDDNEYWLFTWADMGLYDDTANIKMIKEHTDVEKVFYVGYSQGTIQMFYGLAHLESEFHVKNIHKVVLLAPCFYCLLTAPYDTIEFISETSMQFQEKYGVYATNGPNWTRDLQTLCDNLPQDQCDYFTSITGLQASSVQSDKYYGMNGAIKRFQEFDDQWLEGTYETPLVSLESIKQVPIAMFTATKDQTCPYEVALAHIPRIASQTTRIDVEGVDHDYFYSKANSDWFLQNLYEQLQVPATAQQQFLQ